MTGGARSWPRTRIASWTGRAPVAVALDAADQATALRWARALAGRAAVFKVGLELFYRAGAPMIDALRDEGLLDSGGILATDSSRDAGVGDRESMGSGAALFLDLKLHDIPATVAGGVRSVLALRPRYLTVHASGGEAMVRAAVEAAGEGAADGGCPGPEIAAVTVLTSLAETDLGAVGLAGPARDAVVRLSVLAVTAGATALVCSPNEVAVVRAAVGNAVTLITPGVRLPGGEPGDQARVSTPEQALKSGSDLLVVGRPITAAADPAVAFDSVVDALALRS
jgi:orotidine-5'-phosphate decarboxylase